MLQPMFQNTSHKILRPNVNTELYCVMGNPVAHSLGPVMHNTLFEEMNINAVYLAFCIENIQKGVEAIRELGIRGASITIPFKENIMEFLDEIDEEAGKIGAVNTVINMNGRLYGLNTDCAGAINPLKEVCSIKDKNVFIFGAGGAARAVAFGIKKEQGNIYIVNRTKSKGKDLAGCVNGLFVPMPDANFEQADIIINTTSLGMTPDVSGTPVDSYHLHRDMTVMDIVYNPLKTRLLKDANKAGCKIIDGLSMFVNQGACQFELFTGLKPDQQLMRESIIEAMF